SKGWNRQFLHLRPMHIPHLAVDGKEKNGMLPRLGDLLFYTVAEGQECISVHKFISALQATGLWTSDPRLRDCMSLMQKAAHEASTGGKLNRELFRRDMGMPIALKWQTSTYALGLYSKEST
uniref:Glutaminase EF-hand domain-containing protein n=1 Tax=Varanus komodoensis TaxID=61221 RepID=A0A8D2KU76_VARKO